MSSIHGHEVMRMMVDSGKAFSRPELVSAIKEKYGETARFHTCSAEEMTAEALVDFLEDRGKFTASADGLGMDPQNICDHE